MKCRNSLASWIWFAAAAMLLTTTAFGQVVPTTEKFPNSDEREINIIRANYQRLVELTRSSGLNLEFELSDFETLKKANLGSVLWLDRVSMPGGDMIAIERGLYVVRKTGDQRVEYKPSWTLGGEDYLQTTEAVDFDVPSMTVGELLRTVAGDEADFGDVASMTSYAVTARLEGHERSYRAAVFWLAPKRGLSADSKEIAAQAGSSRQQYRIVDHITQALDMAATESMPVIGDWEEFKNENIAAVAAAQGVGLGGGDFNKSFPPTCTARNTNVVQPWSFEDTTLHLLGRGKTTGAMKTTCSCATNCMSSCSAAPINTSCSDSGFTYDSCHKAGAGFAAGLDFDLTGGPTSCPTAYHCAMKSCLFCNCGLTVSVEPLGFGFQFAPSSGTTHSFKVNLSSPTCSACFQH